MKGTHKGYLDYSGKFEIIITVESDLKNGFN